jgi:hypothetical protein
MSKMVFFRRMITHLVSFLSVMLFLVIIPAPPSNADDIRTYTAKRTTGAITIDGKLNESDWTGAPEARLTEANTGKDVPLKSTVKVLWDDKFLYVGFYFEDPDAWATLTNDEDPLWGEEVAEVFIDPESKSHSYYEYEINPINKKVDLFVLNQGPKYNGFYKVWLEWNFSDAMKHAVYVEGNGKDRGTNDKFWTIELAFPFEEMWTAPNIPPKNGESWRIGFYRIEHPTANDKDTWYAAFNPPLRPSFHTPWMFGRVLFKK